MWETIRNPIGTRKGVSIINTSTYNGVKVETIEYQKLLSPQLAVQAEKLYFMHEENLKVRQLAISIENDEVQLEAGAMSYFQGNLDMVSGVTLGNAIGRAFKGAVTGEAMAKPIYRGTGLLVTEPSYRHFISFELGEGEKVVVDKGMFYMATGNVKVEPVMQSTVSSAALGGEGLFQIGLTGPGLVVCESSVCMDEVDIINLNNDTLRVDGNFAILRTGGIKFRTGRSAKTLVGSAVSGEGLVNIYEGTCQVWLAPTLKVYAML